MRAMTPPKRLPPFHRTAASGTLPIEQTKESIATSGPASGPQSGASRGWFARNRPLHQVAGTHAPSAPAISSPPPTSFQTAPQPITTTSLLPVHPSPHPPPPPPHPPPA